MMARAGVSSGIDRNYILSFKQRYPPIYAGTAKVTVTEAGEKIAALNSTDKWRYTDTGRADGERQRIIDTLRSCKTIVRSFAEDNLPDGTLRELAKDIANSAADFHDKIHAHQAYATRHTKGEDLLFVSEQFALMFDRLFDCRQLVSEFRDGCDSVEYMLRTLWVTLKTHMLMYGFVKNELKYDPTISASFIHFFTK